MAKAKATTDAATGRRRLGRAVARLRREAGLSQVALARRAGVKQPHVSKIESGTNTPTLATLARIAAALYVPVGRLLESP